MENIDVKTILISILNRIDGIIDCLPIKLQNIMMEIRTNVSTLLIGYGYNDVIIDVEYKGFLDMVTLYRELNYISRDLGICLLLNPGNVIVEDSVHNISFIIRQMAFNDGVFRYCYSKGNVRILK